MHHPLLLFSFSEPQGSEESVDAVALCGDEQNYERDGSCGDLGLRVECEIEERLVFVEKELRSTVVGEASRNGTPERGRRNWQVEHDSTLTNPQSSLQYLRMFLF